MPEEKDNGMVIVYTGDGKGKTTAALGLAIRAIGHENKVMVIQFLKGGWGYGELKGAKRLHPDLEIRPLGIGCVGILNDDKPFEEHQLAAGKALKAAHDVIVSLNYDIIILDEINIAAHLKLITVDDIMKLIEVKPDKTTLVLTGRYADDKVIEAADLVTEMKEIKHPLQKGILSRKGIDY
jgi:cob(I)alamin adenosyltransferase